MASEEGLRILLEGEVTNFVNAMRTAAAAVNGLASATSSATSGFNGAGNAASRAARDTQVSAEAAARAAQAFADLGKRVVSINELTDALSTLRRQAAGTDSFASLQQFNQQIQIVERELARLQSTGRVNIVSRFDSAPRITRDIQQAQAALTSFATAARNTNFQFNNLSRAPSQAGQAMGRFGTQTANAGGLLVGFTRIAQDAPFGFIAIQNNLTETFGAFQQLSRQLGSSGAAFKALGAQLLGAGGIGLAFSVITSLITTAIQKYGSLGNAMVALNPFISDQVKAQTALNNAIAKGMEQVSGQIAGLDLLYKSAKDLNIPLSERKRITEELIKQYPDTFNGLTAEALATGKADKAYKELTKTLLAQAAVKAGSDLIAQQGKEMFELALEADKLQNKLAEIQKRNREDSTPRTQRSLVSTYGVEQDLQNDIARNLEKQNKLRERAAYIQQQQLKIVEQFGGKALGLTGATDVTKIAAQLANELAKVDEKAKLTGESAKKVAQDKLSLLSKAFDEIATIGGDKAKPILEDIGRQIARLQSVADAKNVKSVADILKELNDSLAATDAQAKTFGISTDNLAKEKLVALNKAFDELVKIGLKPTSPELKKITKQIDDISTAIIGVKPLETAFAQPLGKAVRTTKIKPLTADEFKKMIGLDAPSQLLLDTKIKAEPVFEETPALENLNKFAQAFTTKMGKLAASGREEFKKHFIIWGDALTSGLTPAIADLSAALKNGLAGALSTIGESIGQVFAAGGGISNVLNGIINSMSDFIIAFGRQLIEAGTLALIAQKSIVANPYLAIAAGVGAIAIGSALKNSVPHFATGGVVNEPTLAMVGDNPSGVEYMIPKEVMDKMGGGAVAFIAETRVSGSDIAIVYKRAVREGLR